jgi:hypothetical protein
LASIFTTALLGSAVVVGSVLVATLARDATSTVKPCVGELCPRKSRTQDVPDQAKIQRKMKDTNQGEQMQGQDQSPGQVMARKKVGESSWRFDSNRNRGGRSTSTGKVDKAAKTTAVVRTRADKKTTATALITATTDKKTNAVPVLNERADNGTNKIRALWPYERRN